MEAKLYIDTEGYLIIEKYKVGKDGLFNLVK